MGGRALCRLGVLMIFDVFCSYTCEAQHRAEYEVTVGIGAAAAAENDIFNVPFDHPSNPEFMFMLGFRRQTPSGVASGLHFYGATERTPPYLGLTAGGVPVITDFRLSTFNLGVDIRYSLLEVPLTPYVYAGVSGVIGAASSPAVETKILYGFSAVCGLGIRYEITPALGLGLEGLLSPAYGRWQAEPFVNSRRTPFDPSLGAIVAHVTFMWGRIGAAG